MGNRVNVAIRENYTAKPVYLYSHWDGEIMPAVVQAALKKRKRWNDGQYLARIIFCEMLKNSNDEDTGYGISSSIYDNNNPIILIDVDSQTVSLVKGNKIKLTQYKGISFEDFIAIDSPNYTNMV